jgi:hypothetical protein
MEMDKYLKWALITMSLMIGVGIFYHYVIYLPGIEKVKVEKAQEEKRKAEEKERQARSNYQNCLANARQNYEANWAQACETLAKSQAQALNECLSDRLIVNNPNLGINFCKQQFRFLDSSQNCSLPQVRSESINQTHRQQEDKCLTEARSGL